MNKLISITALILLITINTVGQQRYVLIDRKLKQPLQLVDTITKEQQNKGFFVVEQQNVDSLVSKLQVLEKRLRKVAREHYDEIVWPVGKTLLTIKVVKLSFADRLNVSLSTDTGNGYDHSVYIVDAKLTNNDNARYLKRLIEYINKSN